MSVLIDTDVAIELLRHNPKTMEHIAKSHERILVSSVTAAELYFGASNSRQKEKNIRIVDEFLAEFQRVFLDDDAAKLFGKIKAILKPKSVQIAPLDLMIASIALRNDCILATGNIRHFSKIPELKIANWIR